MAKMTKKEADARLDAAVKNIGNVWEPAVALLPKLRKLIAQLDAAVKKGESADLVQMTLKSLRLHSRTVAEGVVAVGRALAGLQGVTDDAEVMAVLDRDLMSTMREATDEIEKTRNTLRDAKAAMDRAETFLAAEHRNADSAGEEWSAALLDFERIVEGAGRESKDWAAYAADAHAAAKARDRAKLSTLQKSPPAAKLLAAIGALPRGKPFAAFDKRYTVAELPAALRGEIERDRAKAEPAYARAQGWLIAQAMTAKQVAALAVERADARKGLTVLGLPAAALARLQAAIDVPAAQRIKQLDALARALKLDTNGRTMDARLAQAGVV